MFFLKLKSKNQYIARGFNALFASFLKKNDQKSQKGVDVRPVVAVAGSVVADVDAVVAVSSSVVADVDAVVAVPSSVVADVDVVVARSSKAIRGLGKPKAVCGGVVGWGSATVLKSEKSVPDCQKILPRARTIFIAENQKVFRK